jgi:PAS domain S-box-containing protein
MKDENKPNERLVKELKELRQRISELEKSEIKHKRAQEALSESEEKYRTLIDQSIDGILIIQDFHVVFANKAFAKISGYTVKELLSLSPEKLKEVVHPEDQALVWGRYKARLEGKSLPPQYEFRGVRKDGQVRWLEMHSSRINYNGKPAIQAAFIDITERKEAEKTLSKSERKYRTLIEQSMRGIIIVQDNRIVFTNKAFAKICGYTVKELSDLPGEKVQEILHPEDRAIAWKRFRARLEGKKVPSRSEYRAIRKDGSIFWMEGFSKLIEYQGKPAIQAAITDITERKQVEEELKKYREHLVELVEERTANLKASNERLQREITERKKAEEEIRILSSAVEQSIDGIGIADLTQKILYANKAIAQMHGYSPEEMIGMKVSHLHNAEQMDEFKKRIKLIKTKGSWIGEIGHLRRDGTPFPTYMSVTLLKDDEGKPAGILAATRDITEQKEAEAALKETELRYQALFESVPVGIGLATLDGRVLSCNETMCQIGGYSQEEFEQVNLRDIYKDPKKRDVLLERLKKKGFVRDFEAELKRKDGTFIYARLTINPITVSGNQVLLTLCEDITERKKDEVTLAESEAILREQKEALEQKTVALGEIIAQIEIEKNRIKEDIETNVDILINPILEDLKRGKAPLKVVNLLHHHLERLTSSYGTEIVKKKLRLSPREIEVCNMIKGGFTSKDISNILNISYQTVERHRKNIRHKLGISNKPINLTSYLREL